MTRLPVVSALLLAGCVGEAIEAHIDIPATTTDAGTAVDAGSLEPDAGITVIDAGLETDAGIGSIIDAGTTTVIDAGTAGRSIFLLVGKQGRRAISCDEGRTWTNDIALDDALPEANRFRCFSGNFALPDGGINNTDCDHNAWSSTSLTFIGDAFIHTMGWGAPGTFWRSTDGLTWSLTHTGPGAQDIMVGPNRLIVATRAAWRSNDRGRTWVTGSEIRLANGANDIWNVRGGTYGGGTFIVSAQDGANVDYQVSRDDGATWQRPQLIGGGRIDACGSSHPVYGNGTFVTATWTQADNRSTFCRSLDQGLTWSVIPGPSDYLESRVLFTGTQFIVWSNGKVFRSTDGATWTTANTSTRSPTGMMSAGPNIGPVAFNDGVFVAARGGWQVWYDRQRFYRSTDGITWDELPEAAARRNHPVTMMVAGRVPDGTCP